MAKTLKKKLSHSLAEYILFNTSLLSDDVYITQTKQNSRQFFKSRQNFSLLGAVVTMLIYFCVFVCVLPEIDAISVTIRRKHNGKSIRHNHWIMNAVVYLDCKCVNCAVWSKFTAHLIRQQWCILQIEQDQSEKQSDKCKCKALENRNRILFNPIIIANNKDFISFGQA